jgi:hypothetical protein
LKRLTIEAADLESARGLCRALAGFDAKLEEDEHGVCLVIVTIESDRDIVEVLGAIERHIRGRNGGPARIGLDGNRYVMEPN